MRRLTVIKKLIIMSFEQLNISVSFWRNFGVVEKAVDCVIPHGGSSSQGLCIFHTGAVDALWSGLTHPTHPVSPEVAGTKKQICLFGKVYFSTSGKKCDLENSSVFNYYSYTTTHVLKGSVFLGEFGLISLVWRPGCNNWRKKT